MSLKIIAEGSIIIKYVDIRLYLCSDCYHYFSENEAKTGGISTELGTEHYDICPDCNSSNIVLHVFKLKVTKLKEKRL